jgi:hypothetical protein
VSANGAPAEQHHRGFVLVLVVDAKQATSDEDAIVRVCHDYDVTELSELEIVVADASTAAVNQLRLRAALGAVLARATAGA